MSTRPLLDLRQTNLDLAVSYGNILKNKNFIGLDNKSYVLIANILGIRNTF